MEENIRQIRMVHRMVTSMLSHSSSLSTQMMGRGKDKILENLDMEKTMLQLQFDLDWNKVSDVNQKEELPTEPSF